LDAELAERWAGRGARRTLGWKLEAGSWKLEAEAESWTRSWWVGGWKLEAASWAGSWNLEAGSWKLEAGSWNQEFGRGADRTLGWTRSWQNAGLEAGGWKL
jgi:hypothetical protein